jgi:hypothetical protein
MKAYRAVAPVNIVASPAVAVTVRVAEAPGATVAVKDAGENEMDFDTGVAAAGVAAPPPPPQAAIMATNKTPINNLANVRRLTNAVATIAFTPLN